LLNLFGNKSNKSKYRAMWDALNRSQGVIEFKLDGTIISANDNFLSLMGYKLGEIRGRHHSIFCDKIFAASPEYAGCWLKLRNGETIAGEFKRHDKNGTCVWIEASYNPVLNALGKVVSIVKFATDITRKKEVAAANAGRMAALNRSQAVIEFDIHGHILDANDNFLNVLGYTLDEIRGKHHRMFVDQSQAASSEYKQFWEKLSRGEYEQGEYKRIGKDGREVWIQATYNPIFDADGKPVRVVKFASDITAQKIKNIDNDGKIAAINRAMGVIEFDLAGRILSANTNFLNMIGYDLSEVLGQHHRVVCDPDYVRSIEYQKFWEALNRGEFDAGRYRRIAKGNREIWIQATYTPIFGVDGTLMKVVKFASDITQQVRSELVIREQATKMASATEQLTHLVASISDQSDNLATGTERAAAQGIQAMTQSIDAMHEIEKANSDISNFVQDIQEIAAKTNLLALNATIEASRAGEHGKGFTVVASEINMLATRSSSAASSITRAIEGALKRVETGSAVAKHAGENFDAIVATVKDATDRISKINGEAVEATDAATSASAAIRKSIPA
jgi:methyl-accepting chemotaxis protein